jgi:CelD/BcsL family acetyltransferase involved in cellulose biosynthesis
VSTLQSPISRSSRFAPPDRASDESPISCECFDSIAAAAHLRPEWDRLVEAHAAPVYHTYDWCRIWWNHYGAHRDARLFLFRRANRLVGIVPMCIDRLRLGPISLRLARLIGSDFTQAVCDPPFPTSDGAAIFGQLVGRLIMHDHCDAVLFTPLSDASPRTAVLRHSCHHPSSLAFLARDRVTAQCASVDLPETADAYRRSLSKKQRYALRKAWDILNSRFVVSVDTVTAGADALTEFDAFVGMHNDQWRQHGKLGHFGDWPRSESFNRALVAAHAVPGRVRFFRLLADDRVIARHYCFVLGNQCYWRLPARAAGPQWTQYGLGRLSVVKLFEQLIAEGVRRVEAGIGQYDYKRRLGARHHNVRSLLLVRHSASARLRARLTTIGAALLDQAYYKLWYLRLAPHAPWHRHGLATVWIRSRL